jgi:signal transduction histidine kinase
MDTVALRNHLQAQRAAIADAWLRGISTTSFGPRPLSEMRARLDGLVDTAIEAIVSEPFSRTLANSIGLELVDLHYLNARAASESLRALGLGLTANLSGDDLLALEPRLIELLAEMTGGFYAASREAILREQDEVREALFAARQQVAAADEARAIAEASARARSDLLGQVAHDLRSPLTSIKGQADLIAQRLQNEPPPQDWLRSRVSSIRVASDRMQAMIGELLDATRLGVGEPLELELSAVNVVDAVRRAVQQPELHGRTVRLEVTAGSIVARVDPPRFERVLFNLLSNAAKYSPPEQPIDVRVEQDAEWVHVVVRDYGVGIPADELTRITTPFYRASTAGAFPGTGLGLSGVKAIVEQHGGHLTIESRVGQGTAVTLSLTRLQGDSA